MKTGKRLLALALTLTLMLGLVPSGLTAWADTPSAVVSVTDWAQFVAAVEADANDGAGKTYQLENDLSLSGELPVVERFKGVFDGNGHTIGIASGSYFAAAQTEGLGLFCELEGATVKNVFIGLTGELYAGANRANLMNNVQNLYYGVLAGRAGTGSTISSCALYQRQSAGTFYVTVDNNLMQDAWVGGVCGKADGAVIEQCFVDIYVKAVRSNTLENGATDASVNVSAALGGALLCGWLNNATVRNCSLYYGEVHLDHCNPHLNDAYSTQAASVAARATGTSSIRNITSRLVYMYVSDLNESSIRNANSQSPSYEVAQGYGGRVGDIIASGDSTTSVQNCYVQSQSYYSSNEVKITAVGNMSDAAAYLPNAQSETWALADNGYAALRWMAYEATLSLAENNEGTARDVSVDVTLPQGGDRSALYYSIKANVMGAEATPTGVTAARTQNVKVSAVKISYAGDTEPAAYYAGGVYGFKAVVSGENLPASLPVVWTATDGSGALMKDASGNSIVSADGALSVPANYIGDITISVLYDGSGKSDSMTIHVKNPITIASGAAASVKAGAQAAFGAVVHYFGADEPAVSWNVSGGTATISDAGVLAVPVGETVGTSLTVTASLPGGMSASHTVLVTKGDPTDTESPLELSLSAGQGGGTASSVTVETGAALTVTVTGPAAAPSDYYEDSYVFAAANEGESVPAYTGNLATGFVFGGAGSAVLNVTRAYYSAETHEADETPLDVWYASAKVTVSAPSALNAAQLSVKQAADATGAQVNTAVSMSSNQTLTLTHVLTKAQENTLSAYKLKSVAFDVPEAAVPLTDNSVDGQLTLTPAGSALTSVALTVACTYTPTDTTTTPVPADITLYGTVTVNISQPAGKTLALTLGGGSTSGMTEQTALVTVGSALEMHMAAADTSYAHYEDKIDIPDTAQYNAYEAYVSVTGGSGQPTVIALATELNGVNAPAGSVRFTVRRFYMDASGNRVASYYGAVTVTVRAAAVPPAVIAAVYTKETPAAAGGVTADPASTVKVEYVITLPNEQSAVTGAQRVYRYAFSDTGETAPGAENMSALTGNTLSSSGNAGEAAWFTKLEAGDEVYLWLVGDAGDTTPGNGDPYPTVADSAPVVYRLQYDASAGGLVSCVQTNAANYPASSGYAARTIEFSRRQFSNAASLTSVRAFLSAWCVENGDEYWRAAGTSTAFPPLSSGNVVVTISTPARLSDAMLPDSRNSTARSLTQQITLDNVTPMPLISARNAGGLLDNTFTIDVPADTQVYYTLLGLAQEDAAVDASQYPTSSTGTPYTAGDVVAVSVTSASDVQMVAMAVAYKEGVASDVDLVRFNVNELSQPLAPGLEIEGEAFSSTRAYEDGKAFGFTHDVLSVSTNQVYYTTNGLEPQPGSTVNGTQKYDPAAAQKPVLSFGTDTSFVITAVIVDTATGRVSASRRYDVRAVMEMDAPLPSLSDGSSVAGGSTLYLRLTDDACAQIQGYQEVRYGEEYHAQAIEEYKAAVAAGETPATVPDYAEYVRADNSAVPIDGVEYLIIRTSPSQTSVTQIPQVRYLVGGSAAELDTKGQSFRLAVCQIYEGVDKQGNAVTFARFINPSSILLSGAKDDKIVVHTKSIAADGSMKDSAAAAFTYTIRGAANPPTSYPETAPTAADITALRGGDAVSLLCDAGSEIYYTDDGTIPSVVWDRWKSVWVPQGTTQKYTSPLQIPAGNKALVTISAVAASTGNLLDVSPRATFIYQPPAAVQAVYATVAGESSVVDGAKVELLCGTEDAKIFYKTYTSKPADTDIPEAYHDTSYIGAIEITQEVWIRAIATLDGVDSVPATYHYTVAPKLAAPTVSLPSGRVVNKGTRILLAGEGTIAYTLDGSDPTNEKSAVQYGSSVVLDGDYGKAVTLRAYVQKNGYTPSDVASFTYTLCEQEAYITASPAGGTKIATGTAVTLTTAVSGAQIFYTLDGSTPALNNVYTPSKDKSYTEYEWTAGTNTFTGGTVTLSGSPGSTVTLRAVAVAGGAETSETKTFAYTFREQAGAPTASIPTGAVVLDGATVTLTAKEGSIYYTLDGTAPTTSSALYTKPIDVSGGGTLRAYAVVEGKEPSNGITCVYTSAGTAAAPTFSQEPGAIAQGSYVTLATATRSASIYYSLDGTVPGASNLDSLTLYSGPIQITRGVTIKAIAVLDTLRPSTVSTAQYTVVQPEAESTAQPEQAAPQTTQTDRLQSRRTYSQEVTGPTYSDTVLTESATNTVVSAKEGVLTDGLELVVERVAVTDGDSAAVKSALGNEITAAYNVELRKDGEAVQPGGEIEIGFAIPAQYQNAVVAVARINDDGTATVLSTRRSDGMAYVITDHLSKYALTVPVSTQKTADAFPLWTVVSIVAGVALLALMVLLLARRRKARAAGAESEEPFDEGFPDAINVLDTPDDQNGGQNTPQ